MIRDTSAWTFVHNVTHPALTLASPDFLSDIAERLDEAGVRYAVRNHDSTPVLDWMLETLPLQGISDAAAYAFDARNGGIRVADIARALGEPPQCDRLRSFWSFDGCGYRKSAQTCASPNILHNCALPRHRLRKGGLNVASFGLYLFMRDVCGGDLIGWVDARLAAADPGEGDPDRNSAMRDALLAPLTSIPNTGPKLWSMILSELLCGADALRERWVTTGASFVAVDSLVHAHFHRTGILHRLGSEHRYGDACYGPGGCAEIIAALAGQIDAREFNPSFPRVFPRYLQHAIWQFCATGARDVCNGVRIAPGTRCTQTQCPSSPVCERLPFGS